LNYYRRYVGDYLKDTARLSILEHGAYNLLLDYYYAEEQPIPLDIEEVCRMVRAIRPEERRAVEKVLAAYFVKDDDGYHNARADDEIAVSGVARANGARGGRPATRKLTGGGTGTGTGIETGTGTRDLTGLAHPPSTIHHPPSTNHQTARKKTTAPSTGVHGAGDLVPGEKMVEQIPLCDGTEYGIGEAFVKELDRLYPAVDPAQTLREIRGWCLGNPKRRKTARGVKAFITSWFAREQDRQSRRAA